MTLVVIAVMIRMMMIMIMVMMMMMLMLIYPLPLYMGHILVQPSQIASVLYGSQSNLEKLCFQFWMGEFI